MAEQRGEMTRQVHIPPRTLICKIVKRRGNYHEVVGYVNKCLNKIF